MGSQLVINKKRSVSGSTVPNFDLEESNNIGIVNHTTYFTVTQPGCYMIVADICSNGQFTGGGTVYGYLCKGADYTNVIFKRIAWITATDGANYIFFCKFEKNESFNFRLLASGDDGSIKLDDQNNYLSIIKL